LELDLADFSVRSAVGDTLKALAVRAHKKGLELIYHVQPDVPDALVGDAGRLRQVLLNLVGNAIKFTDKGEVLVTVELRSSASNPHSASCNLHFSVKDTGIGIFPHEQKRIFRAFEQEDTSTTRKYGGTGLGLTISSQLVALMGGQITVDSQPGRGSTFEFTARFTRQEVTSHERRVTSEDDKNTRSWLSTDQSPAATSLNVLVAEDNEFNAQLLEQLLGRCGHRVNLASNGREALCLAAEGKFDLLLLDIHMPELDGFQAAEAVREQEERTKNSHLPIIALTARSRNEDRERCLAAGMDDFLAKPIQAADLWAAMDRVLGSRPPTASSPTACSPAEPPSVLDPDVLLAACGGDAVILEKICQVFRARLPEHLKAVKDSLRDRDAPRLSEVAHKLAGMVAAFSSVAGGVASTLEDLAAQDKLEEAPPLVAQLEAMTDELTRLATGLSLDVLRNRSVLLRS
jgi:CheY-like chemotaxis protein